MFKKNENIEVEMPNRVHSVSMCARMKPLFQRNENKAVEYSNRVSFSSAPSVLFHSTNLDNLIFNV